jgi:hypothetical protein
MGNNNKKEVRPVQERPLHDKLTNKQLLEIKEKEWYRELSLEKSINFYFNLNK